MKKLFETVKAWLRSRVTALKSEKVNTDGGHWHTWIIVRSVRH